jgi:hypothetical protein
MSASPPDPERPASLGFQLLEWSTAIVLGLVVAALGWMLVAAYLPNQARLGSDATEVVVLLVLLTAALLLLSGAALAHTRK